jgi:hypothetical protein
VAATVGSLVGAYLLFGQRDLARGHRFVERHGSAIVLFGRFVPRLRSIVSVPAGLARMPLGRLHGAHRRRRRGLERAVIGAGHRLGEDDALVEGWVSPVSTVVVGLVALALVWLALRRRREQVEEPQKAEETEQVGRPQDSSRQERQSAA